MLIAPFPYFFSYYTYFDPYWFGQYYYRDRYATAYQPQIAPDSYYEQLGRQWGADVKRGIVPKERLSALIQVQMLNVPEHSQKAFSRGFLGGYGRGGAGVLAQIIKQALESSVPQPMNNQSDQSLRPGAAK
jgi:hypothetical protein